MQASTVNIEEISELLKLHEGVRLKPYTDTVGKLTIGCGRNLDDVGISLAEAETMLANDIGRSIADLDHALPWWRTMNDPRQNVLVNMCFNLGITRLLGFKQTLTAMKAGDYHEASIGILNSKWARQVGQRAVMLADIMKNSSVDKVGSVNNAQEENV